MHFTSSTTLTEQKTRKSEQEELTNSELWDNVLSNHPEHAEKQGGDLLYEYPRKSYFGYMSAGSLAHITFWSWLKGYEQSLVEMHPILGEPTFFSFVTDDLGSSLGFGMSIILAGLIGFHARRTVARISIVAGGDKLRFTTHKFFGNLGAPIDVPISYVSAHPNTKNNIILKLSNTRGFFLVDTKGKFYNREKLERMITFRTNFKEHEKMMEKETTVEVRTDLPRVDLKAEAAQAKAKRKAPTKLQPKFRHGNLLGKKHSSKKNGKNRKS
ncbi:Transmembrane protein 223 [Plasmopara halstedii]|uniref:Transmembrane protein 223 n=1 Tax=Plasmopara halstedii TaxID=4781 RepID=A0A0N7L4T9_PLAHL|nr:Transmembrane protein 223 [Plasmopara halstedii]CEG39603.1 Transmembrane protein 223 [Plasmopara halstedii]|eukprot:XP_024575972.1 Transmembrane protein 223 [Plasmopara halstedii]